MLHAFGYADVKIKWKMFVLVIEFFQLRSYVSHYYACRKIFVLVKIVKTDIERNGTGRVFRIFGIDETHCGTADPIIGKRVTILGSDAKILG